MDPLTELLNVKKEQLKVLKKELKQLRKGKNNYSAIGKVENKINELEQFIKTFSKSNMQPVKIEGIVINFKLYERFMKKLKSFHIEQELKDNKLFVHYNNGSSKGTLTLEDISEHFPDTSKIQEGDLIVIL